jgi:pimeloyl-ACP methyl ester carboxylesterase
MPDSGAQLGAMSNDRARLQQGPLGQVPVQLIVGGEDTVFLAHAQRLQGCSAQISSAVLPECGHNPLLEAPAALRAALWP